MKALTQAAKWTTQHPELGTGPLPVDPVLSEDYFERERERIFKRSWLNIGRAEEVLRPGNYIVKDIPVLNASVVVVRSQDGVIRSFHNVCRHRGNRVVNDRAGAAQAFMCGFHGWTYDPEGRLVYVPDEDQFHNLKKEELSWRPVATDVWEGFVFINLDPTPAETLRDYLGELDQSLSGFPFGLMLPVAGYAAEVQVNWKIFMDVFQECYHVSFIHRRSVLDVSTGQDNPLCHLLSTRLYNRHRSASVYFNPNHQAAPSEALAFKYGAMLTQGMSLSDGLPTGVNPERSPHWLFDINVIFPNFILDVAQGTYWTYHFWPIAVDRTVWEVRLYMHRARNAGERISQEFNRVLLRDALREDLSVMENMQSSLASGVLTRLQLSDQEVLVRHAYKVVERTVDSFHQ